MTATPSGFSISGRCRAPSCASARRPSTRSSTRFARSRCAAHRRSASSARTASRSPRDCTTATRRLRSRGGADSRCAADGGQPGLGGRPRAAPRRPVTSSPKRTRIHDEQRDVDRRIGEASVELFPARGNVLTHCNTGPIATGGDGTALGCFVAAHRAGKALHVFVDETRPLLQGARLTMFELREAGVPCTLIVDSAAAITMQRKAVRAVVVGADRIARNGDTANKIGTYGVAIAAAHHGIPFYVAAPRSTFDFALASGDEIPIEERVGRRSARSRADDAVYNPAFDVTPGRLITGFITEYGVCAPPYADGDRRPGAPAAHRVAASREVLRLPRQAAEDRRPRHHRGRGPLLAQRALDAVLDRLLPEDMRALNCDVFDGPESDGIGRAAGDAVNAMPFLADRRVVVVRNCHRLRAQPRRDLWAVAENVPDGNTLVLEDLFPPAKKTKPEPFGQLAGRKALRIDTTPNADVRERFVRETLERLGAKAQPRAVMMLAESDADVGSIRNDLEKLALAGKTITVADLERESLSVEDPKAWQYAAAVVEGRAAEALAIAFELFANDPRGAARPARERAGRRVRAAVGAGAAGRRRPAAPAPLARAGAAADRAARRRARARSTATRPPSAASRPSSPGGSTIRGR